MIGYAAFIFLLLGSPQCVAKEASQARAFFLKGYSAETAAVKFRRALGIVKVIQITSDAAFTTVLGQADFVGLHVPVVAEKEALQARAFFLKRCSAEFAVAQIRRAMGPWKNIRMATDAASNGVFIQAEPGRWKMIEAILTRLDTPQPNYLRLIRLRHTPAVLARNATETLLAIVTYEFDRPLLAEDGRLNAIILGGGTWDGRFLAEIVLSLLDRNPFGLFAAGRHYFDR